MWRAGRLIIGYSVPRLRLTRRTGIDINPRRHARRKRDAIAPIRGHFVIVRVGEFLRRNRKHGARHAVGGIARIGDHRMMRLAARLHDLGVVDLQHREREARHLVGFAVELAAEGGQLNLFELERAIGKQTLGEGLIGLCHRVNSRRG
ncbi:hypothetical protein PT2222_350024 [Paraburkholderia tropica]